MSTAAIVANGHLVDKQTKPTQHVGVGSPASLNGSVGNMRADFGSATEEAAYWRSRFEQVSKESQLTKEEFAEFQEGSRELEAELEAQLEQSEVKIKEYRSLANRLQMDNDQLKSKLEQCHREYHFQISELQSELREIRSIKDELNGYVRELEQQNDDLERAKRSTLASLEDFETKMNAMIERNAFLESELDEKESLKAAVQRLKDETRDLKSELRVVSTTNTSPPHSSADPESVQNNLTAEGRLSDVVMVDVSVPAQTPASPDNEKSQGSGGGFKWGRRKSQLGEKNNNLSTNGPSSHHHPSSSHQRPLTPSARISALNIVGDLLRKVGALELKLSSCRSIVKEPCGGAEEIHSGNKDSSAMGERLRNNTSSTHNLAYGVVAKSKGVTSPLISPSGGGGSAPSSTSKRASPSVASIAHPEGANLARAGSSPSFRKLSNGALMK